MTINIPCGIGDTVYVKIADKHYCERKIESIIINKYTTDFVNDKGGLLFGDRLNKDWFLSEDNAKKNGRTKTN